MKFLHLADLHLGKKVFGYDLDEEQRDVLTQVLVAADTHHVDGVLICGDVYDTATPPISAVDLLDWFLEELHKRGLQVFIISGNHDSASRLNFASGLLGASDVHISSIYRGTVEYVDLEKDGEKVRIHMLPFIKPVTIRAVHQCECRDWNNAMKEAMSQLSLDSKATNILMSHQFYAGSEQSDSEVHAVGMLDQIAADFLYTFDYAALGHLHKPQSVGRPQNRYPGTLLKFSASELKTPKTLTLIETYPGREVEVNELPIHPKRDFILIRGTFDELVSKKFWEKCDLENYFYIMLEDEQEVFQVYEKLQTIYPRLLKIEYSHLRPQLTSDDLEGIQTITKTPEEIFAEFFELQNGISIDPSQMLALKEAWEAVHETD